MTRHARAQVRTPPALPASDRLTSPDRAVRALRRGRGRLLCRFGAHLWGAHRNPEVSGWLAVYHLCRRCGREKNVYLPGRSLR